MSTDIRRASCTPARRLIARLTGAPELLPRAGRFGWSEGATVARFMDGPAAPAPLCADAPTVEDWGRLPELAVVIAAGLMYVAVAYTLARNHVGLALPLFWAGMLTLVVPAACRLVGPTASRRERIALVVLVGLGLYLVKVLHDPAGFASHDEFLHWHTADSILRNQRLFGKNSLLPVSPLYPGLEDVTAALASLSGLSIFWSGSIVVGAARILLMLALFLFVEQIGGSSRVAGLTSLLYCMNFSFLFFDAQFGYESLALPLAVFALYLVAKRARCGGPARANAWITLTIAAVVVTHHLTTYALVAFLFVWWLIARWRGRGSSNRSEATVIGRVALLTLGLAMLWLVCVAHTTIGYLAPTLGGAIKELLKIISGETGGRAPFQSYAGETFAPWERLLSVAALALITVSLPLGALRVWRDHRTRAAALALAAAALTFPASQVLRLTHSGSEFASRSPEFLFVGIAFLLAVTCMHGVAAAAAWRRRAVVPVFAASVAVLLVGGIFAGFGPSSRILPGTYRVAADMQSIEPEGVDAAHWARTNLGPGNRVAADRINRLLMGSYGEQYPVTNLADHVNIAPVFTSDELGSFERSLLRQGNIRYLVVDRRLSEGLPLFGVYFENGEPGEYEHSTPINLYALLKFNYMPGVSKVFDSGNIAIYDVEALSGAH